jgi:hypothetical protein
MNKEEQEIIESTKEFAKAHNIHYDQMTENMILNAMREQLLLHNVSQQRELLKSFCEYIDLESRVHPDDIEVDIENHLKIINSVLDGRVYD